MTSPDLSRRLERAASRPPLSEMSGGQRRELDEALATAETIEDLPGKWQAAILEAEGNEGRPGAP